LFFSPILCGEELTVLDRFPSFFSSLPYRLLRALDEQIHLYRPEQNGIESFFSFFSFSPTPIAAMFEDHLSYDILK